MKILEQLYNPGKKTSVVVNTLNTLLGIFYFSSMIVQPSVTYIVMASLNILAAYVGWYYFYNDYITGSKKNA